jgi:mannose-6-phosphate isomerase-like protein (cupin superfamily)
VKLAKLEGEFVWHHHENEDELFLVLKGRLVIQLRDREITLDPGEFLHRPQGRGAPAGGEPGRFTFLLFEAGEHA